MPRADSRITRISGLFLGLRMVVHNDTAILFTGRPAVDVFDLKSETWSSLQTTYSATPANIAAGILGDKLYILDGTPLQSFHGLDLSTRQWRWLSGTPIWLVNADQSCPGPPKTSASWVNLDKTRILLFGVIDLDAAHFNNELRGADEPFGCSDFWSWSVKDKVWRPERMKGNPPCSPHLACDPDTGRTYMFSEWVPRPAGSSRAPSATCGSCFPGGHFDEVDVEEEMGVAKAGRRRRFFTCAGARPWRRYEGALGLPFISRFR
ncbi:hypothetical protein B0H13DRAFT_2524055 [Mycena leptocephala]|nr:hypothetical protein B0H13DRAFT_2524055 [Mycena leptocephala]